MGQALARGIIDSSIIAPGQIGIVEISSLGRELLENSLPNCLILAEPVPAHSTLLAVKPLDVENVCSLLEVDAKERVLSIAAGVSTSAIEVWLGGKVPVIRAMPNTPALIGKGMTAVSPGRFTTEADLNWSIEMMSAVGKTVVVKEEYLDAITAVSGSGPAYLFLVAESMIDAAVASGLAIELATELVGQTLYGSGALLVEGELSATQLRHNVTSPGGTTAAALAVLEEQAVRASFASAIAAAKHRSREIGAELFKH